MKRLVLVMRAVCLALLAGLLAAVFSALPAKAHPGAASAEYESGLHAEVYSASAKASPNADEPDGGEGNADEGEGGETGEGDNAGTDEGGGTDETTGGEDDIFAPDSVLWIVVGIDGGLLLILVLIGIISGARKKKRKAKAAA